MSTSNLEERVLALEAAVEQLKARLALATAPPDHPAPGVSAATPPLSQPWVVEGAGRFANDPVFDEIVRLGQEYRRSLRPSDP